MQKAGAREGKTKQSEAEAVLARVICENNRLDSESSCQLRAPAGSRRWTGLQRMNVSRTEQHICHLTRFDKAVIMTPRSFSNDANKNIHARKPCTECGQAPGPSMPSGQLQAWRLALEQRVTHNRMLKPAN